MTAFADLDPDRHLALSYVPMRRRPAVKALWELDVALGQVLAGGREPMISRIKLAWWREALEKLGGAKPPAEPVLEAIAAELLPLGVSGEDLAGMEEGWTALLSAEALTRDDLELYGKARGATLFELTARILCDAPFDTRPAGAAWALVDFARHSADPNEQQEALALARAQAAPPRWPSRLRPLGMLSALAARDADPARPRWEEKGSPARMWRMLRHRLTGR